MLDPEPPDGVVLYGGGLLAVGGVATPCERLERAGGVGL